MKGCFYRRPSPFARMLGLALILILSACKREDHDPPAVALSLPSDGFTVSADSNFEIAGVASDDQGLSSITATLYETSTEVVVQTASLNIGGRQTHFNLRMRAGDRYTPTGSYSLRVTAFDRSQNTGAALTLVDIQELPLVYRGAVWAGDLGAGNFVVQRLDTSGNVVAGPTNLPNLSGLLVDSRNAQLIGVQAMPGWLSAWSMDDLAPLFQVDLPQGTGTPTYSGVSMNRFKYYGSLAVPPYVRSYTYAGATVSGFEDCLYPATAIYAGEERVYVALQGELGLPMKVDAYNVQDNRLVATQPTDWPVIQILPISGQQLMVLGNEAGVGKALVIDRSTMARDQELTLPGACIGGVTAHGRVWILTDQAVYEFFPSNGTFSVALVTGSYSAIAVDATLDHLFLGASGRVDVYSGAGALQQRYFGAYGDIKFIDIYYNK